MNLVLSMHQRKNSARKIFIEGLQQQYADLDDVSIQETALLIVTLSFLPPENIVEKISLLL